ncbi:MAG TPA: nucleotidyltransferase family protein [Gemmatimonadaceae bacterium]|nr:nucleotidyltransferase family protein [Gemmatimonadaceae bacterium]
MLSPEARLVLASAARDNDAALRASLGTELDWGKVLWLAEHERATSVLWQRLSAVGLPNVPAAAAEQLHRIAMVSDFRMLYMRQRLEETVRRLAHEGIDVMMLKGAALAEAVYGSFTARPMNDLDLLVPHDRAQEARDSLLGAGWAGDVDEHIARIYEHHHHLPPLVDVSGTEAKLELHTSLFLEGHPFVLTAERVWDGRQGLDLGGVMAYVPSLSHMLLHTCLHFAWSNQLRSGAWRTLRDVDHIVGRRDMNWPEFVALAGESKAETLCYWSFRLASGLIGTRIPGDVMRALSPGLPPAILRRLARHYVHQALPTEWICPSERVGRWMWSAGMRPARSGYGRERPWRHEDRIRTPGYEELGATDKVTNHLRQLPRWGRYLRLLIQPL